MGVELSGKKKNPDDITMRSLGFFQRWLEREIIYFKMLLHKNFIQNLTKVSGL